MRKNKIKTIDQKLELIKMKVNQGLQHVHALVSKFGKSKNSAMLVICALPEDQQDKETDFMIAYAGEAETIAKVMIKKAKQDEAFNQLMIYVLSEIKKQTS